MRRFDGHGSSSYRPTNPEVAKQQSAALRNLLAERERQDAGLFGSVSQNEPVAEQVAKTQQITEKTAATYNHKVVVLNKAPEETGPTYSLSDAGPTME
jgi:hypothetical protein